MSEVLSKKGAGQWELIVEAGTGREGSKELPDTFIHLLIILLL